MMQLSAWLPLPLLENAIKPRWVELLGEPDVRAGHHQHWLVDSGNRCTLSVRTD